MGAKQVAAAGSALFGLCTLLHIAAFNVWLIIPARIMQGMGMAVVPVATATVVANLAPAHRRAEAMSYMGNSIGATGLYAPVVAFWLVKTHGFASAFACASAVVLLGSLIALSLSAARTNLPVTIGASDKVPLINRGALFPTMVFPDIHDHHGPGRHLSAAACREPRARQSRPVLHHVFDNIHGFDGDLRTDLRQGWTRDGDSARSAGGGDEHVHPGHSARAVDVPVEREC